MKVTIEHELGKDAKKDALVLQLLGGKQTTKPAKAAEEEEEDLTGGEEEDLTGGEEEEAPEEKVTLDQLKAEAQRIIGANKSAGLKAVLKQYNAAKVVDIKKADYSKALAAMKKVK